MSYIGKGIESVTFNTATTFDVTGNITVGGTVDGRDVATDGTKLDTITSGAIADIVQDTTPQLGGNLDLNTNDIIGTGNINVTGSVTGTSFVSTGNMSFTNNSKAIFGTSPSLEIYHDGSNSILDDVGAGNFKMQLAGSDKLEITSTGVDVTGTVTATSFSGDGSSLTGIPTPTLTSLGIPNHDDITVDGSGNVGIGTTSPDRAIKIHKDNAYVWIADAAGGNVGFLGGSGENDGLMRLYEGAGHTAKVEIHSDNVSYFNGGNVGIGTASPSRQFHLHDASGDNNLHITNSTTGATATDGFSLVSQSSTNDVLLNQRESANMRLFTANTEAARIDSSQRLLVGKTSGGNTNTAGFEVQQSGFVGICGDGIRPVQINRKTSDGDIIEFRKNGTTVGSIGTGGGDLTIGTGDAGLRFYDAGPAIYPRDTSGNDEDGTVDLGLSGARFKDLHLSGTAYVDTSIGIGTSSPDLTLDVSHNVSSEYVATFQNTADNLELKIGTTNTLLNIQGATVNTNAPYNISLNAEGGNVGIGTTSPGAILDVGKANNAGDVDFRFFNRGAGSTNSSVTIGMYPTNSSIRGGEIICFADNPGSGQFSMRFLTSNTTAVPSERMRIDSGGNLLVGKTTTSSSDPGVQIYNAGNYGRINLTKTVSGNWYALRFEHSGSIVGSITYDNSSTAYNTSSDYRLKTAVNYDWDATTRLKQLRPARFEWIADGDDAVPVDGFLAHEVQTVVPEAISGTHDEVDDDGNPVYQGIDQSKLVPLLVKTIQELEARITALENT